MKNKLLVSLNLPKTDGISFSQALLAMFSKGFLQDILGGSLLRKYLCKFLAESFSLVALTGCYKEDLRYLSEVFLKTKLDVFKLKCAQVGKAGRYEIDNVSTGGGEFSLQRCGII